MQAQGSADLMSIGQHCAWPDCGQLDFLPFKCGCGQTFCLEHRTAAAHKCRLAGESKQVIVCPICAQGVEFSPTDDPNLVFDRHQRDGCDPSNYARVYKKPRCPVQGCKEKLTTINTYTCKDCREAVCLRHRLPMDHKCAGPSAAAAAASAAAGQRGSASAAASAALSAAAAAGRSFGAKASNLVSDWTAAATAAAPAGRSRNTSSQQQQPQPRRQQQRQQQQRQQQQPEVIDLTNSVRGTAHRRQQEWQQQQQQQPGAQERCPQCGQGFAGVQELIQHVEAAHSQDGPVTRQRQQQQQRGGGGAGGEVFVCPRCSTRFSDAVMLVSHSEACGRNESCSLC